MRISDWSSDVCSSDPHGDIPSSVRAIKGGAVDFLTKPFSDADLMIAVEAAIAQDREARPARAELRMLRRRYLDLTPRELEVLPLVVSGQIGRASCRERVCQYV